MLDPKDNRKIAFAEHQIYYGIDDNRQKYNWNVVYYMMGDGEMRFKYFKTEKAAEKWRDEANKR